ncbi:MAG TPA: VOC family protein, partial [Steroidobacteraceae bacterium]
RGRRHRGVHSETHSQWLAALLERAVLPGCRRRDPVAVRGIRIQFRIKVEGDNGRIEHSELSFGEGLVMVAQEDPDSPRQWKALMRSPRSLGGAGTQSIMIYVDDVDAHCVRARSHGARIVNELATHDYGADYWADRSYVALDPEGHQWCITQRLRDPPKR